MTRTQFYEYKKRFQERGLEGLKDLPPVHKSHPQTTPPEVQEQVIALSLEHPSGADLDAWLVHYNTERPHRGYRNMGQRPIDTVNLFQNSVKEEG